MLEIQGEVRVRSSDATDRIVANGVYITSDLAKFGSTDPGTAGDLSFDYVGLRYNGVSSDYTLQIDSNVSINFLSTPGHPSFSTAQMTKTGNGTLTLNTFNGQISGVNLDEGTLAVNGNQLGSSNAVLQFNGGTLRYDAAPGTTTRAMQVLAGGGTVDTAGNDATWNGALSGSGNIEKIDDGTLFLGGSNTQTGTRIVSDGILHRTGSGAFNAKIQLDGGEFRQNLASGASLAGAIPVEALFEGGSRTVTASLLDGTALSNTTLAWNFTDSSIAANDGVRITPVLELSGADTMPFVLQLAVTGPLAEGSYLAWLDPQTDLWVNAVFGNYTGTANFVGDTAYGAQYFAVGNYGFDTTNGTVWAVLDHNSSFAAVPEPSTFALIVLGGLSLAGGWRWKKRRRLTNL